MLYNDSWSYINYFINLIVIMTEKDKIMKYLIFLIILFSSPLYAVDLVSSQYTCTHKDNDLFREVKIIHKDQGCEVTYTKAVGTVNEKTRSLWRAKNSTEYCDNKGHAFVEEKLQQEFGWVCIDTITK